MASATESNPLGKVMELMDTLAAKITAEGDAEAKAFKEYFAWCRGGGGACSIVILQSTISILQGFNLFPFIKVGRLVNP